ncbi:MAG: rhomboid family intramembrane serine protease [Bacteroidales bacterium]
MFQNSATVNPFTKFLQSRSALVYLIGINVVIWIVIFLIRLVEFLFSNGNIQVAGAELTPWVNIILSWLAVPASLPVLAGKPYTVVTYMFLHEKFMHILFNMLWLYLFGQIFLQFLSGKQLLATYIYGGLSGALIFIAAFNFFPVFEPGLSASMALGASASVMAIVVCISFFMPDYTVHLILIGPVKIKYIAIFFLVMDIAMIPSGNAGGHFAHLGGAIWGFSYVRLLKSGFDPSVVFSSKWLSSLTFSNKSRKTKFKKVHVASKPVNDDEYNRMRAENQKRIDVILEKISRSGYSSLTKEEKEFLFKSSKKS